MVEKHRVIGNIPFKPMKGFVSPKHRFTGPYNPLHLQLDSKDNPLPRNEPYNVVDAISMRHVLVPEGKREKVDKQLGRSIIGMRLGIDWSNQMANELHKPVRRRSDKRTVFAKNSR